jgi:death-on-curing protein
VSLGARFLSVEDVLTPHAIAIESQGGDPALRDRGLLESAVAMPRQQFGGQYGHEDIPAMAAAYAFHICRNHPFVDGNKRAGAAAMIAFLSDNGWSFDASADEAEPVVLQLASGQLDKSEFEKWAARHMHEKPRLELRDFFARLDPDHHHAHLSAIVATQGSEETNTTIAEARRAIPLIAHLESRALDVNTQGDTSTSKLFAAMFAMLVAIFRIAEDDMGYEW